MKTAVAGRARSGRATRRSWPTPAAGWRPIVALTKPRIGVMVLVTVATGFLLGAREASHPSTLALTMFGTGLVAGGAGAWNQYLERSARPADAADGEPALAQRPAGPGRGGGRSAWC